MTNRKQTNLVVGVTAPVKRCQIFTPGKVGWGSLKTTLFFFSLAFSFPKKYIFPISGATLPACLARLLQAARNHRDSANPETPIVVVTTNGNRQQHHQHHHNHHHHDRHPGADRAGVYCAVSHSWDQLLRQGQVIEERFEVRR